MAEATADPTAESEDVDAGGGADERLAFRGPIQQLLTRPEIGALLGVGAVWMLFWLVAESFGTVGGTANFLDVAAVIGIMAVPVALLMIGGEFDLSSGSMTGATGLLVVLLSKDVGEFGGAGLSLNLAVPLVLAFALTIGWFNGTLVEKTSLPSFIVTLGTFFILIGGKLGVAKLFTDKVIVEGLDEADGYDFWNDIFGAEWIRNNHIWDGRDWAWAILLTLGGVALLLGVLDLTFQRRQSGNAAGIPVLLVGAAGGVLGFVLLLTQDGSGTDWVFGIVAGAGVLVGVAGWCLWRYERAAGASGSVEPSVYRYVGIGVASIALGIVVATVMDAFDDSQLDYITGTPAKWIFFMGFGLMGLLALLVVTGRTIPGLGRPLPQSAPVIGIAMAAIPAVSFLVTVQAARALLFVAFSVIGLLALSSAARRARSASSGLGFAISMLTAAGIAVLALFIHFDGESRKISVELAMSVMLVALAVAAMAVASLISAVRTSAAPHAHLGGWSRYAGIGALAATVVFLITELGDIGDSFVNIHDDSGIIFALITSVVKGAILGFVIYAVGVLYHLLFTEDDGVGRPLLTVGIAALGLGLAAKLLFITGAEAEVTQAVTRFRVSVLFYLGFAAAGTWLLTRTQFGSWTFAVGGNKDASRSVGVPAARTKTTLFMMVSVAAFVTGMVIAFRLNSVQSNVGDGQEFRYIIVAVVGGNLLTGGYGSALGAALGALIWGMISQGIGFAGWNTDWRFLVLGALLLVAVIINNYVRGRAEKMST